jgi:hypothetical protein
MEYVNKVTIDPQLARAVRHEERPLLLDGATKGQSERQFPYPFTGI